MPVNSFVNYYMSWRPVFDKSKKPYYLSLAVQLEEDIQSGLLLPGTKLPPQRELADFLDLNLSTVAKAFSVCEAKGLLIAKIGKGTFVQYGRGKTILLPQNHDEIQMGATIPEIKSYYYIKDIINSMLQEEKFEELFSYGKFWGRDWQCEAGAEFIQKAKVIIKPENILLANGGQNAIAAIMMALVQYGDKIGTDSFTYPGLKTCARMVGVQLVSIRDENGNITAESIANACINEKIKVIYLIADYNNPTTLSLSVAERKILVQSAEKYNLTIIEDAIYAFLRAEPLPAIASYDAKRTIYIASLSKVLAPGLRLAYIAVPDHLLKLVAEALYNLNVVVSPFMAELATRLLVSEQGQTIMKAHMMERRERNALVDKYFNEYCCAGDNDSLFRWLILPRAMSEAVFVAKAKERGVIIFPSEKFAIGLTVPANAVRLALTTQEDITEFENGLKILLEILEQG